jgi:phospholipid/cholesterol/gamma-HCH transport system substrate-binding protein
MSMAVKVGLFATLCLLVLAYLILRVEDVELFAPAARKIDAVFDSVAGLDDKAAVRVAGVRVGRVDGVGLDGARARVTLRLEQPLQLTLGTKAAIATVGLLGEKYVELIPGPREAAPLPEGAVLEGTTPPSFDDAMAKLDDVVTSIQSVTGSLTGEGQETNMSRLIANLEATSADIRGLVAANREQVTATIGNFERFSATMAEELPRLTRQIEQVLGQVDSVVAENRANLQGSLENIRDVTESLQTSVDNLNQITGKIAGGEGTIGKLVQSEEAHDRLTSALESVDKGVTSLSETLGRAQKIKLDVGLEGYYLSEAEDGLMSFGVDVDPQSGRFYRVGLVDDPRGRVRSKTTVETVTGPDGVPATTRTEKIEIENKTTLNAQLGFIFRDFRLRGGLFESTGGAAVDYDIFRQRLRLSLEAFDFSRPEEVDPHLRLLGRFSVFDRWYVVGGYDDFLLRDLDRDSLFLGAGVTWTDEDLKYLLGSVPLGR